MIAIKGFLSTGNRQTPTYLVPTFNVVSWDLILLLGCLGSAASAMNGFKQIHTNSRYQELGLLPANNVNCTI